MGYAWRYCGTATLDIFARYLWNRQGGDSVMTTGDRVDFDSDDSHRVVLGARYSFALGE